MGELMASRVNKNNFPANLSGIVNGFRCAAVLETLANCQQDGGVIDHEFIALHHTAIVIISAYIDNGICLFKNGAVKAFFRFTPIVCLCLARQNAMEF